MNSSRLSIPSQDRIFALILIFSLFLSGCSKVNVMDLPVSKNISNELGTPDETAEVPGTPPVSLSMNTSVNLRPEASKVDLLLVIDDSGSMKPDSLALAAKLEGFVRKLEAFQLDWQMCLTVTDTWTYGGGSFPWAGINGVVLKKGTSNLSQKFLSTIDAMEFGASGSGDERGIAAMNMHLDQAFDNQCYRPGAAVSVILISDEDERSVGGTRDLNVNQYKSLEDIDLPENYISNVQRSLGSPLSPVPLTVHSIIIKPQDQSCLDEQNNQGYAGYVGTYYDKLSKLTGGSVGSICSKDYSENLSVFAERIQKSLQRVKLNCVPAPGWKITTVPILADLKANADGDYIIIESRLTQETHVNIEYSCK